MSTTNKKPQMLTLKTFCKNYRGFIFDLNIPDALLCEIAGVRLKDGRAPAKVSKDFPMTLNCFLKGHPKFIGKFPAISEFEGDCISCENGFVRILFYTSINGAVSAPAFIEQVFNFFGHVLQTKEYKYSAADLNIEDVFDDKSFIKYEVL